MANKIIILGGGVTGLTTAICLLKNGYRDVLVLAKLLPGDLTTEYTSPWAGAAMVTAAEPNDIRLQEMDMHSIKEFERLANTEADAHVMHCPGVQYVQAPNGGMSPDEDVYWARKLYSNFKVIPKEKLVSKTDYGYTFDSFTVNVPKYLKWLLKTVQSLGGCVERKSFNSIQQIVDEYPEYDTVVNCTALGSKYLEDVKDQSLYPVRGQTILVRAPHIKTQQFIDCPDSWTYVIPRDDGTVICGGTVDRENSQSQPDEAITKDILERVYRLCPEITHNKKGIQNFDIVSINVGFRPARQNGIRLEKEYKYRSNGQKITVCHNYGHGSYGYQTSWGSSMKLVELLSNDHVSKL